MRVEPSGARPVLAEGGGTGGAGD